MKRLLSLLKTAFITFLVCGATGVYFYPKIEDIDNKLNQQLNPDLKENLRNAGYLWKKHAYDEAAKIYFSFSGERIDSDGHILGRIADSFEKGYTVKKNKDTALNLRKKAAEIGDGYSAFVLGKSYFDEGNYTAAEEWLKKCVEAKYKGEAAFYLGKIYSGVKGVKMDKKLVEKYYVIAADGGKGDSESYTVAAKYYYDKNKSLSNQYASYAFSIDTPAEAVNFILTALESSYGKSMADTLWDMWRDLNRNASMATGLFNQLRYSNGYAPISSVSYGRPSLSAKKAGDNWMVYLGMSVNRDYYGYGYRDKPEYEYNSAALYIDVKKRKIYSGNQKGYKGTLTLWNCVDNLAGMKGVIVTKGPSSGINGRSAASISDDTVMDAECYIDIESDMIRKYLFKEMSAQTMARVKKLNGEIR